MMIVDDESIIVEGIRDSIPWEDYGIEVVATAGNGLEALPLLHRHLPDILVTDIRMPEMDGLEFIAEAKSIVPSAQIIMISAFEQFSYAQRAIELGVNFYLVKPIKPRDIIEKACQCVSVLDERTRDVQSRRSMEVFSAYRESLLAGDSAQAGRILERELKSTGENAENARFVYQQLLGALLWAMLEHGLSADDMISDQSELYRQLVQRRTPGEMHRWFSEMQGRVFTLLGEGTGEFGRRVIREACAYIDSLPPGEISLGEAAAHAALSPSYFSKLFKREVGLSFIDYVKKSRIESAKQLLRASNRKVYEICAELGYQSVQYFTTLFKESVGMTPLEYRESSGRRPE